jgi:predicted GIY-YIG superfamily endonuclease
MATAITFDCKNTHAVRVNAGIVTASPAIPSTAGLYIIRNSDDANTVYVGTSSDLKARFNARLEVYRESGFTQGVLDKVFIYQVKIKVDDTGKAVDNLGQVYAGGATFDVEHLLIRSIIAKANKTVRNVAKWGVLFANPLRERLDVEFENFPVGVQAWIPADFSIRSQATL